MRLPDNQLLNVKVKHTQQLSEFDKGFNSAGRRFSSTVLLQTIIGNKMDKVVFDLHVI